MIQKLVIADTTEHVMALTAADASRIAVTGVPVLTEAGFEAAVQGYFGQPMNLTTANAVAGTIKQFALKHDRLVNIIVPDETADDAAAGSLRVRPADAAAGILRLVVVISRYNELDFKGNRWFSSKLLREKLGIKPGDEVSIARLDEAVSWANTNPFRRIQVVLVPLANRVASTNLVVGVQEHVPLRLLASYDDSGNAVLGTRHYTGSIQYGNFLGLDHQVSYQFATTDHQRVFRAHSLNYSAPLPWRHRLDLSANYLEVHPSLVGGIFDQTGRNIAVDLRYTIPLRGGDSPAEVFAAVDFKQNNNNLAYGGFNFGGLTDTFQFLVGFSTVKRDRRGVWAIGANLFLSPGHLNTLNTDEAFQGRRPGTLFPIGRVGARAQYAYGNVSVQRLQALQNDWQFLLRGTAQLSTANLLGSEQLSIGGSATVRGFDERIMTGDDGFAASLELQGPALHHRVGFLPKRLPAAQTRFALFYDCGAVRNAHPTVSDLRQFPLASSGFGVRMSLGANFNLTADYGWQITRLPPHYSSSRNRGHVKVVLAF